MEVAAQELSGGEGGGGDSLNLLLGQGVGQKHLGWARVKALFRT